MTCDLPAGRALNARREFRAGPAVPHHAADILLGRANGGSHGALTANDGNGSGDGIGGVFHAQNVTTFVVTPSTPKSVGPLHNGRCIMLAMDTLADRVRAARLEAGLSQAELADRIGKKQQTIGKIESGLTLNPKFIVEIADALNVSPNWLKGLSPDKKPVASRERIEEELKGVPDENLQMILDAVRRAKKAPGQEA
ncbi:helix-turn-helix transcriptional regulator [Azospirillum sp. TSO5]|uniref:helix-turn-helix domain-containing protein n=1 Tax=Azospirillum sp. TSO5 TaxID=716760 RepID=UPI001FFF54C3|nr:helix-turn-helix transcriptional regulator [Azospirillum sp. TSO5]